MNKRCNLAGSGLTRHFSDLGACQVLINYTNRVLLPIMMTWFFRLQM